MTPKLTVMTDPHRCEKCRHFYQHYLRIDGEYLETCSGHCLQNRLKLVRSNQTCNKFQGKTPKTTISGCKNCRKAVNYIHQSFLEVYHGREKDHENFR